MTINGCCFCSWLHAEQLPAQTSEANKSDKLDEDEEDKEERPRRRLSPASSPSPFFSSCSSRSAGAQGPGEEASLSLFVE
ncbi:hypothetical protein BV898_05408 [Hypsibius exemplaris]|uniref:Uncharacterized protein n=1 Tax=Hypsibius exemplaris TaxID=2072580 RepID=A0A1W0WZE7_HYPEX|nr:hypothetical protein BV898_05408 [Hypsibius exemplaris]